MGDMQLEMLNSVRQAISLTMISKSMGKDVQTLSALLDGMQTANSQVMEQSVTPYKGGNIDLRV